MLSGRPKTGEQMVPRKFDTVEDALTWVKAT
jgi:hypothetical protein